MSANIVSPCNNQQINVIHFHSGENINNNLVDIQHPFWSGIEELENMQAH